MGTDCVLKQNKVAEKKFFGRFGIDGNDFEPFDERGYERLVNEFAKAVDRNVDLKIADLGCGTGVFTKRLYDKGYNVVGIDISPKCIDYARKKYPGIKFEMGDIEKLPYADGSFDAIALFGVLHHFQDLEGILKICLRLIKKGGILYTFDPHMNNPFYWIYRNPKSPFYSTENMTENESPLIKSSVKNALASAGFNKCRVYSISGVTLNTRCKNFSKVVRIFTSFFNFSECLFDLSPLKNLVGSSIISISRKD